MKPFYPEEPEKSFLDLYSYNGCVRKEDYHQEEGDPIRQRNWLMRWVYVENMRKGGEKWWGKRFFHTTFGTEKDHQYGMDRWGW